MNYSLINYDFIFFALALFFSLAFVFCRLLRQQQGRKDSFESLSKEKELISNLVNTDLAIILFLDQRGTVLRANQYFFDLTGYDVEQVIGKNWLDNFVPPVDQERIKNFFISKFENMGTETVVNHIVKADGSFLEIEWRNRTIKDEAGEAIGIISVGQDITEHRQREKTLRESKSKFAMLNKCFSRFGNSPEENINMLTEVARLISGADFAIFREIFEDRLRTLGISPITEELPADLEGQCSYCSSFEHFGKMPVLVKDLKQEKKICRSLKKFSSAIIASAQIDDEKVGVLVCAYNNMVEEISEENINLLGIIACSMEVEIARMREGRDLVKLIRELASRDKRMSLEMEIARTVHRSFLPSVAPDFPPYEIGFIFKPCFGVGGDYFEFFQFPNNNQLGILFADVSGHGVAGALLASMLKVLLLDMGKKSNEPKTILMGMNSRIEGSFPSGYFVTAFFTLLDTEKDVVKVACAAPEPVLLIRKSGEVELVRMGGQPMGLLPSEFVDDESFGSIELKLSTGDKILFFTDGLTDVKIAADERIGLSRLCEWCKEFSDLAPEELTRRLYERAEKMAIKGGVDDDIMMLAIAKK